jgi:dipeptidyl-peptidase-4
MNKHLLTPVVCVIAILCSSHVAAQDPSILTLERIFTSNEFRGEIFGPARWLEDGSGYTTVEDSPSLQGGKDIVRYHPETGKREVLVSAERLVPRGKSHPLRIDNYEWSPDARLLLIYTNSKRVWRQNTRGDYWVLNLMSGKLQQLGGDAKPSTMMFAKFSPDSRMVGYVVEHNIYVQDIETGAITQVTTDGSTTTINGTFDWVYEEEFDIRDGWRWSPDSKWIAYWQLDATGIRDFLMINNTDSLYPFTIPVQYPKVGTVNSACRVGVVRAGGGASRWMNVQGDPRNNYIARMEWGANSEEIVFQHLNRAQNTLQIMLGDTRNGNVRTIFTDRDSAWVDVGDDFRWLDNGKRFVWVSEGDGWRHVYLISRTGREVTLITPGAFDVISVVHVDEKGGWLYYIASPANPGQRYLFRSRLDGKGRPEQISPAAQSGTHSYTISHDAKWAFHTYSRFGEPSVVSLVRLPSHTLVRPLAENASLRSKVQALKRRPVEFFRIDIGDGVSLDGWMMKPFDFDSTKRYPVLFHVYGEPAGQTVHDRWGGTRYLWHEMLAQQGYLVVSVDNRGTPAPRGRAWRKIVYRQIGILAAYDQAEAARVVRSWPFVDTSRIAIWGWSGGGSMSLNMIFRYPDLYHTAMSVAPVTNQLYYNTIYQERYMGHPEDNPEGYKDGSPITHAGGLRGNLLLIHGTGDDNVHYQSSEALINTLIEQNKHFTMMPYPNRAHGIREGRNTTRHLHELMTRYLKQHTPPGGRDRAYDTGKDRI